MLWSTRMRTLMLCLVLVACSQQPIPDNTPEQITASLDAPVRTATDNIREIGAIALCDPGQAVTEYQSGIAVTYCESAPALPEKADLLAFADE